MLTVARDCAQLAVRAAGEGNHSQAERYGRRSLDIFERELGPGDTEVGITLLNLGIAVAEQGRVTDALPLVDRAAAILAVRLPVDDQHRVTAARVLAALLVAGAS